jgi:MurNAc alpha-1-phosphate uridylyltransferase
MQITRAMVLSAGLGTRMSRAGSALPKPLVELDGKALIDHVLDRLAASGVTRAVVNVHHQADRIEQHLRRRVSPEILVSDERAALLDTGGGVKKVLPWLGADPFFIHNCDAVWVEGVGSNLERLIAAWDGSRMDCLLLLAPASSSIGYHGRGDFTFASDGRIRRRAEAEFVAFVFAGVSLAHARLFEESPSGAFSLNAVWDRAIATDRAYGVRLDGIWMHVGTPEALAQAQECWERVRGS